MKVKCVSTSTGVPVIEPAYLGVRAAAALTGATIWQVRTWAWERRVPFVKVGNRLLFDKADLLAYMESQKVRAA